MMAQDMERAEGIAEGTGDLRGGAVFEEVSSKGFVHPVFRMTGLEEEVSIIYNIWLSDSHDVTISHTICCVKSFYDHKGLDAEIWGK